MPTKRYIIVGRSDEGELYVTWWMHKPELLDELRRIAEDEEEELTFLDEMPEETTEITRTVLVVIEGQVVVPKSAKRTNAFVLDDDARPTRSRKMK